MKLHSLARLMLPVVILTLMSATSCRSRQSADTNVSASQIELSVARQWHDLRIPVSIAIESPVILSVSGRATMVRDSLVDISMRVFGFEVASARVTPDSVFLVDKYHKYYFAEPLSQFLGGRDLSLGDIQNMLLGRGMKSPLVFENNHGKGPVTISFGDYVNTSGGPVASSVDVSAPLRQMDIRAALEWDTGDARWNTYPKIKYSGPGNNYRRITASNVRDMLRM